ncbi:MAG: hypothetical protein GDA40_05955, partial [Rhodobacteraceae bacterium]|nr:hypothetical protein [Paracoccaceae bacterium]
MIGIIAGLVLWVGAHVFKRVAPQKRAAMGSRGMNVVSLTIAAGVLCMVLGYRAAEGALLWVSPPWMVHVNNLLVLVGIFMVSPAPRKGIVLYRMRHPMLTGFALWAVAHILVNGDGPSVVLFGGLLLWALAEIVIINRA